MCRVSSSEITSLHSLLNFFLASLICYSECGNLLKFQRIDESEFLKESDFDLHRFDGEAIALVHILAKPIYHFLQPGLGLFPCLTIDLFGRSLGVFLLLFNIVSVLTRHCCTSRSRALEVTGGVAT